mgnify:CR=1 FL=1
MDKAELVKWMETHEIAETLRSYVINNLKAAKEYEPLADLATKGEAVIKIKLRFAGGLPSLRSQSVQLPAEPL